MRGEGSREGERASFFLLMELSLCRPTLFPSSSASWDPKVARLPPVITAEEPPPSSSSIQQRAPAVGAITAKHFAFPLSFPPVAAPPKKGAFRKLAC